LPVLCTPASMFGYGSRFRSVLNKLRLSIL
jgi:hypothetical protein